MCIRFLEKGGTLRRLDEPGDRRRPVRRLEGGRPAGRAKARARADGALLWWPRRRQAEAGARGARRDAGGHGREGDVRADRARAAREGSRRAGEREGLKRLASNSCSPRRSQQTRLHVTAPGRGRGSARTRSQGERTMASSSSGVDDARLAAEALTIRTLTQQYGFGIETAQSAVKQLGDPSDLELAVTWCLDVGGEEDNGGAVALRHCPHVKDAPIVDASTVVIGKPCADCGAVGENWICLITGATRCSRYVNKCSLKHYEANPEHFLALSLSDLSVWSYKSEHYVSNAEVQPPPRRRARKFGSSSSSAAPAPASRRDQRGGRRGGGRRRRGRAAANGARVRRRRRRRRRRRPSRRRRVDCHHRPHPRSRLVASIIAERRQAHRPPAGASPPPPRRR